MNVSLNGIEMYYETYGEGEPLVLLHGFTGAGSNWTPFLDGLAGAYRLVVPDLRGHGRSTNPSGEFTFRQSALDVFALLDALGVKRFKAIGMSAGAKTLLHMATREPDRVEAMVLVSATPYFPEQARAAMREITPESRTDDEWRLVRKWHAYGDEQIVALWRQANAFAADYDDMAFTPPRLATIVARTLVVHGDRDPYYPVDLAVEMYTAIARAYLWVIPNGGHGPIFGDVDGFVRTVLAFLGGEW